MNTPKEYQSAPQPRRQSKRILQQATQLPTQPPSVKVKRRSQQPTQPPSVNDKSTSEQPTQSLSSNKKKKSFKEKIKSAFKTVLILIGTKKKTMSVYETAAIDQGINDLVLLEEEIIKKVEEENITEVTQSQSQNDIPPLLGEIYGTLIKGINDIITNSERTTKIFDTVNSAEQTTTTNQPINCAKQTTSTNQPNNRVENIDYLKMLNKILKCLEDNFINKSKKKELLFTILPTGVHNIKIISAGITITYSTFKEFINSIDKRFGMILSLCSIPFSSCPNNIIPLIKKFRSDYQNKDCIKDDIFCNQLKNIIRAFIKYEQEKKGRMYLDTNTQQLTNKIPEELMNLLEIQTNGGRKRKPKNIKNKKIKKEYYH